MLCADVLSVQEDGGRLAELVGRFGCEESASSFFAERLLQGRVPAEVVGEGLCDEVSLREQMHVVRDIFFDFFAEERVVRAAENECVNAWVSPEDFGDVFLYEIIGSVGSVLSVFDERHPHGAWLLLDDKTGVLLVELDDVGLGDDRSGCCEYSDVPRGGVLSDGFDGGSYDSENTSEVVVVGLPDVGQVFLLNVSECTCRGGVASEDNEVAVLLFEEVSHALPCVLVNDLK